MRFLIRYLISRFTRLRFRLAGLLPLSGSARLRLAGLHPIAGGAANECIPYYDDGDELTATCTAAVTGKRCVDISGDIESGPGLSATTEGGNIQVAHATAAGTIIGVASYDAALGAKTTVLRGPGIVLPITAGASITAGEEVEVGANGTVIPLAAGIAVGKAFADAANGADAMIALYDGGSR